MIGEYKASVRKSLKLPVHSAGFGIGLAQFMKAAENPTIKWYEPTPRFPKVSQDITLKVTTDVLFLPLYRFMATTIKQLKPEQTRSFLYVLDIYQSPDDTDHKHVTFRLIIASYEKTMREQEVTTLLDAVAAAAADKFKAERI